MGIEGALKTAEAGKVVEPQNISNLLLNFFSNNSEYIVKDVLLVALGVVLGMYIKHRFDIRKFKIIREIERKSNIKVEIIELRSRVCSIVNKIKNLHFSGERKRDGILYEQHVSEINLLKENIEKLKVETKDVWEIFNDILHYCGCALSDLSESNLKKDNKYRAGDFYESFRNIMYNEMPVYLKNLEEIIQQKFSDV